MWFMKFMGWIVVFLKVYWNLLFLYSFLALNIFIKKIALSIVSFFPFITRRLKNFFIIILHSTSYPCRFKKFWIAYCLQYYSVVYQYFYRIFWLRYLSFEVVLSWNFLQFFFIHEQGLYSFYKKNKTLILFITLF